MRLNWLSPLPPAEGPAAALTAAVLPLVGERFGVVLMSGAEGWDPAIEEYAEVARVDLAEPAWADFNRAGMTVYHVDGGAASGEIWRLAQRHPGVVVVHDGPLLPLFVELARDEPADRERLETHVEERYGRGGLEEIQACLDGTASAGDLADRYPLTGLAARGTLGVLVGSRDAAERLASARPPVAVAPPGDPAAWAEAFAGLVQSARRYRPLSAGHVLAEAVSDELAAWSGFAASDEHAPRSEAGTRHPLHRRFVTPVGHAVDELLRQTREGGAAEGGAGEGGASEGGDGEGGASEGGSGEGDSGEGGDHEGGDGEGGARKGGE